MLKILSVFVRTSHSRFVAQSAYFADSPPRRMRLLCRVGTRTGFSGHQMEWAVE